MTSQLFSHYLSLSPGKLHNENELLDKTDSRGVQAGTAFYFLSAKGQVKLSALREDTCMSLALLCPPLDGHEGGRADLWMRRQGWG